MAFSPVGAGEEVPPWLRANGQRDDVVDSSSRLSVPSSSPTFAPNSSGAASRRSTGSMALPVSEPPRAARMSEPPRAAPKRAARSPEIGRQATASSRRAPADDATLSEAQLADERLFWSEAMVAKMKSLQSSFGDEFQRIADKIRSDVGVWQDRVEVQLEHDRRELQASEADLRGQLEEQRASLGGLTAAVADLRDLCMKGGAAASAAEAAGLENSAAQHTMLSGVEAAVEDLRREFTVLQEAGDQQGRLAEALSGRHGKLADAAAEAREQMRALSEKVDLQVWTCQETKAELQTMRARLDQKTRSSEEELDATRSTLAKAKADAEVQMAAVLAESRKILAEATQEQVRGLLEADAAQRTPAALAEARRAAAEVVQEQVRALREASRSSEEELEATRSTLAKAKADTEVQMAAVLAESRKILAEATQEQVRGLLEADAAQKTHAALAEARKAAAEVVQEQVRALREAAARAADGAPRSSSPAPSDGSALPSSELRGALGALAERVGELEAKAATADREASEPLRAKLEGLSRCTEELLSLPPRIDRLSTRLDEELQGLARLELPALPQRIDKLSARLDEELQGLARLELPVLPLRIDKLSARLDEELQGVARLEELLQARMEAFSAQHSRSVASMRGGFPQSARLVQVDDALESPREAIARTQASDPAVVSPLVVPEAMSVTQTDADEKNEGLEALSLRVEAISAQQRQVDARIEGLEAFAARQEDLLQAGAVPGGLEALARTVQKMSARLEEMDEAQPAESRRGQPTPISVGAQARSVGSISPPPEGGDRASPTPPDNLATAIGAFAQKVGMDLSGPSSFWPTGAVSVPRSPPIESRQSPPQQGTPVGPWAATAQLAWPPSQDLLATVDTPAAARALLTALQAVQELREHNLPLRELAEQVLERVQLAPDELGRSSTGDAVSLGRTTPTLQPPTGSMELSASLRTATSSGPVAGCRVRAASPKLVEQRVPRSAVVLGTRQLGPPAVPDGIAGHVASPGAGGHAAGASSGKALPVGGAARNCAGSTAAPGAPLSAAVADAVAAGPAVAGRPVVLQAAPVARRSLQLGVAGQQPAVPLGAAAQPPVAASAAQASRQGWQSPRMSNVVRNPEFRRSSSQTPKVVDVVVETGAAVHAQQEAPAPRHLIGGQRRAPSAESSNAAVQVVSPTSGQLLGNRIYVASRGTSPDRVVPAAPSRVVPASSKGLPRL